MPNAVKANNGENISQPAIRSAWDVVKGEVTLLALSVSGVGFFTVGTCFSIAACMLQAKLFNTGLTKLAVIAAVSNGVGVTGFGVATVLRIDKIVRVLKNLRVPNLG